MKPTVNVDSGADKKNDKPALVWPDFRTVYGDKLPVAEYLNFEILSMMQMSVRLEEGHEIIKIGLEDVPSCDRYITIDVNLNEEGKVVVLFYNSEKIPGHTLELLLVRSEEQIPELADMMRVYLRQGLFSLFKYPEIRKMLDEAFAKVNKKIQQHSTFGRCTSKPSPLYNKALHDASTKKE